VLSPASAGLFLLPSKSAIFCSTVRIVAIFLQKNSISHEKTLKLSARIPLPETTAA
jgi:hypothetical protein